MAELAEVILEEEEIDLTLDPRTLGTLYNEVFEKRAEAQAAQKRADAIKAQQKDLEAIIMAKMDQDGTKLGATDQARISITETTVAGIEDWETALDFIFDNDLKQLLYRQLSAAAFKELLAAGEDVPGVRAYTRRGLSIRKAPKK